MKLTRQHVLYITTGLFIVSCAWLADIALSSENGLSTGGESGGFWGFTRVLLSLIVVVCIFRGIGAALGLPLSAAAKIAGYVFVLRFLAIDFKAIDFKSGCGQTLELGLILLAFAVSRRGLSFVSGCVLSLPIVLWAQPILFLPWIIYRGRWSFFWGAMLGCAVFGLLPRAVSLGPRGIWNAMLLSEKAAWAEITASELNGFHIAAASVLLGVLLIASWKRAPGMRLGWTAQEIASAALSMPLLAPSGGEAQFLLLWPAAVLGFEAWRLSEGRTLQRAGSALWSLAFCLVLLTSPSLAGASVSEWFLAHHAPAGAALLLLFLISYPGFFPRGGLTLKKITQRGLTGGTGAGCGAS